MTDKPRLGIYEDLSEDAYHADDALGSTDIKTLSRSTEEFYYRKNCPGSYPTTSALILGSAIHCLVLDGVKEFFIRFKIRRKPRGKEFWGKGITILSREDFKKVLIWYRKLKTHPASREVLEMKGLKTEVSYFWQENDIRFKCRFDILINNQMIVDLKTVENIYKEEFDKFMNISIAKYGYHIQAQHYMNGLKHLMVEKEINKKPRFIFLFIEKSLPFRVGRKLIGEDILEAAQTDIDRAIFKYKEARENNYWVDWNAELQQNITLDDMPAYF